MKVGTLDLHAQFKSVEKEVRAAMERVIASQHFILGPEIEACEKEIASYSGAKHGIGVSSGTDAILVALMALDVGPGDEIVTTPYTFVATATCIARLGAKAVMVDIDPKTYALDASKLDAAITPKTKAIVPVHLFGQMADMKAVHAVAKARNLPVIEDAAQAIGARRDDLPVGRGSIGATLSFFPSKNLGCMGDGGMVISDDDAFATKVRMLRNQGQKPKYTSQIVGGNFRLDELQAAVVRAKLPFLDGWTSARQKLAGQYKAAFAGKSLGDLEMPYEVPGARHVWNQFCVRTSKRDALMKHLAENGISTTVYYPIPMHLQPCFKDWGYAPGAFPEAEKAANESVALPLYPELDPNAVGYVVDHVAKFFA